MRRSQNILLEIGIFSVNHFLFGIQADQITELVSAKHPEFLTSSEPHALFVIIRHHHQPLPVFDLTHKLHLDQPNDFQSFLSSPLTFITSVRANLSLGFVVHVENFISVRIHSLKPLPKIIAAAAQQGLWGVYETSDQLIPLIDLSAIISNQDIAQCQHSMNNMPSDT